MNRGPETKTQVKERMKQRRVHIDENNYQYIPETIITDHYDNDVYQRVAVYVRVSTDDPRQTTSYELQKQYYEEFEIKHPKWELVHIYADEGISATSTGVWRHRYGCAWIMAFPSRRSCWVSCTMKTGSSLSTPRPRTFRS